MEKHLGKSPEHTEGAEKQEILRRLLDLLRDQNKFYDLLQVLRSTTYHKYFAGQHDEYKDHTGAAHMIVKLEEDTFIKISLSRITRYPGGPVVDDIRAQILSAQEASAEAIALQKDHDNLPDYRNNLAEERASVVSELRALGKSEDSETIKKILLAPSGPNRHDNIYMEHIFLQ